MWIIQFLPSTPQLLRNLLPSQIYQNLRHQGSSPSPSLRSPQGSNRNRRLSQRRTVPRAKELWPHVRVGRTSIAVDQGGELDAHNSSRRAKATFLSNEQMKQVTPSRFSCIIPAVFYLLLMVYNRWNTQQLTISPLSCYRRHLTAPALVVLVSPRSSSPSSSSSFLRVLRPL